jgi:hypothetical protein
MRRRFSVIGGRRARILAMDPAAPLPVLDPTDPGQGRPPGLASDRVTDPTDPRCTSGPRTERTSAMASASSG